MPNRKQILRAMRHLRRLLVQGCRGPLDLNAVVRSVISTLQTANSTHREYRLNLGDDLQQPCISQKQIERLIRLLCMRAERDLATGDHIAIETASYELSDDDFDAEPHLLPGQYVSLSVAGVHHDHRQEAYQSTNFSDVHINRCLAAADLAAIETLAERYSGGAFEITDAQRTGVSIYLPIAYESSRPRSSGRLRSQHPPVLVEQANEIAV